MWTTRKQRTVRTVERELTGTVVRGVLHYRDPRNGRRQRVTGLEPQQAAAVLAALFGQEVQIGNV